MSERMFNVGESYITHDGYITEIVSIGNPDTGYETACGDDGKHRYNRRDYGRCTGTDWEVPSKFNLEIPAKLRHLITHIPKTQSIDRAIPCTCGSKVLRAERNYAERVQVRCLSCGRKSINDSNTNNAVNNWNKGETT
jgi:DNA-directed RNA polymerase subunit RPC12/RpoP